MEVFVEVQENVRGEDMFVIQSTSYPANDNLMELLIIIDALKRRERRRITAVIPYFGYARQDRKVGPRTPISAKLVANLITEAGAHRVLTVDLHAGQIQGFFDIPTDNLYAAPVMVKDIQDYLGTGNLMVVSPDVGGVVRARALAKRLGATSPSSTSGASGRRIRSDEHHRRREGARLPPGRRHRRFRRHDLQRRRGADRTGAKEVCAYATHGVLSGGAVARIQSSKLKSMVITDSIAATEEVRKCRTSGASRSRR
jgi:ribose-phosphate pyrophosphokinase